VSEKKKKVDLNLKARRMGGYLDILSTLSHMVAKKLNTHRKAKGARKWALEWCRGSGSRLKEDVISLKVREKKNHKIEKCAGGAERGRTENGRNPSYKGRRKKLGESRKV